MAISFSGTCVTPPIVMENGKKCFVMENSAFSRVAVNITRLVAQMENLELMTGSNAYMPFLRTRKLTGIASGGIELPKASFDTALNSDDGVRIRALISGIDPALSLNVTGTPETVWSHFTSRRTTGVEQQQTEDISLLPLLVENSPFFKLLPGEALYVEMLQGSATGTLATGGLIYIQAVWDEDNSYDAGYTVSGQVTLNSSPVEGAKVFVLTDLTVAMTDPKVKVKVTASGGTWSEDLASGVKAAAFVQYDSGGDKYTDEGKPYLEKP